MDTGDLIMARESFNDRNTPSVSIVEHPQERGYRFRYTSEGQTHGGLQGRLSRKKKKTYPTIRIHNYYGPIKVLVQLVCEDSVNILHPHLLVGKSTVNGFFVQTFVANDKMIFPLSNLSICHVTKREVPNLMESRIVDDYELRKQILKECGLINDIREMQSPSPNITEDVLKNVSMNSLRLRITVYLMNGNERNQDSRFLKPIVVYTDTIRDAKCANAAPLKICRVDKLQGSCKGGDEIYLLCDKIQKDDISIRFYESDDASIDGRPKWEDYGKFSPQDVHHQYAIVFKTPPYFKTDIKQEVCVKFQLQRTQQPRQCSDPVIFKYQPSFDDYEGIISKKRKYVPQVLQENRPNSFDEIYNSPKQVNNTPGAPTSNANYPSGWQSSNMHLAARQPQVSNDDTLFDFQCLNPSNMFDLNLTEYSPEPNLTFDTCLSSSDVSNILYENNIDHEFLLKEAEKLLDYQTTTLRTNDIESDVLEFNISESSEVSKVQNLSYDGLTTALHLAVAKNNVALKDIISLIVNGAKLSIRDFNGDTPLHIAVKNNCSPFILSIILRASDLATSIDMLDAEGSAALHSVTNIKNGVCLAEILLQADANADVAHGKSGRTPLYMAVDSGNYEVIKCLLKYIEEIDQEDNSGYTPLQVGVLKNDKRSVSMLIRAGANPTINEIEIAKEHDDILSILKKETFLEEMECSDMGELTRFLDCLALTQKANLEKLPELLNSLNIKQ